MRDTVTLRRQPDLDRVFREGSWRRRPEASVGFLRRNDENEARVAFVAGRRVGSAVVRNRARRRLREAFRHYAHRVSQGVDIVLVARDLTADVAFARLHVALERMLADAGLFDRGAADDH